jgi:hypothetical protein
VSEVTLRFCPLGNHFSARARFRRVGANLARDCMMCEAAKAKGRKTNVQGKIIRPERRDGVDIDAIYKLPQYRHLWRRA